jgi:hypothetical protein
LATSSGENGVQNAPKRSSLKNWKGGDVREDPGNDGKRKQKEIFKCQE